jgi:hypothetical protein
MRARVVLWRALPALLAPLALLIAGCAGRQLSSSQLRSRATRVCSAAAARTDRIAAPAAPAGVRTFLLRGVSVLDPELRELRSLRPPRALATTYSTAIRDFSRKVNALSSTAQALSRGADPVSTIDTLQQRLAPVESAEDSAWTALAIPACVNR